MNPLRNGCTLILILLVAAALPTSTAYHVNVGDGKLYVEVSPSSTYGTGAYVVAGTNQAPVNVTSTSGCTTTECNAVTDVTAGDGGERTETLRVLTTNCSNTGGRPPYYPCAGALYTSSEDGTQVLRAVVNVGAWANANGEPYVCAHFVPVVYSPNPTSAGPWGCVLTQTNDTGSADCTSIIYDYFVLEHANVPRIVVWETCVESDACSAIIVDGDRESLGCIGPLP